MSGLLSIAGHVDTLRIWVVDANGKVAIAAPASTLLPGITRLLVPIFNTTEDAVAWGSQITSQEHSALLGLLHSSSTAALGECNLELKANLTTQSQFLREATEAFVSGRR